MLRATSLAAMLSIAAFVATPVARANATSPQAPAGSARDAVDAASKRVLDVLNSAGSEDEKLRALEQIGDELFDLDTVSRLVLAKNWRRLDAAQQAEFRREFRQLMISTYGRRIDEYGNQSVQIVSERAEPRGDATVMTKVVGGKEKDYAVSYRLRPRDGQWRFIDIVVEGVSIVSSYRSQFQELMSQGGPENLLAKIKEKNARAAAGEEIEAPTDEPAASGS